MNYWIGDEWRWRLTAARVHQPTIAVIERNAEGYDEYADRREREKGARRVPFGFARALATDEPEPEED